MARVEELRQTLVKLHDEFHNTVARLYDAEIEMRRQVKALERYAYSGPSGGPSTSPPSPAESSSHSARVKKISWRRRLASTHVLQLVRKSCYVCSSAYHVIGP